jgi:hypothetical protein
MRKRQDLRRAAYAGDIASLRQLVLRGGDVNEINDSGETLLSEVVGNLCADGEPFRYEVVAALLELGASPTLLDLEGCGPLTHSMFSMDTRMLQILLEGGADAGKVAGFDDSETFYDWAEFDYRYNVYDCHLPEAPSEEDRKTEEAWLAFLDRIAIKYHVRRPDHLYLLRAYGARSMREFKATPEIADGAPSR